MLTIIKDNYELEIEFNNIRILDTNNTSKLYKDLFLDSKIYIDQKYIRKEDVIYINELSKLSDFINLSKKSFLQSLILEKLVDKELINNEIVKSIINEINDDLNYDILDFCDGDTSKIINLLIEINSDFFINQNSLDIILQKCFDSNKLIILDNISWLEIKRIYKYFNSHNFIVLTNDFRNNIKNKEMMEIVSIYKNDGFIDIMDSNKIISYLEMKLSEPITNEKFNEFLSFKDSLFSLRTLYLIKNM